MKKILRTGTILLLTGLFLLINPIKEQKAEANSTGWKWEHVKESNRYEWKFYNYKGQRMNQFFKENGKVWLSYADPDRSYFRGWWVNPDNNYKYFFRRTSGSRVSGWQHIDSEWRYFRSSGTVAIGHQCINGRWYYLSDLGVPYKGWKDINGQKYFFRTGSGTRVSGRQYIDGKWHTFSSSGVLLSTDTVKTPSSPSNTEYIVFTNKSLQVDYSTYNKLSTEHKNLVHYIMEQIKTKRTGTLHLPHIKDYTEYTNIRTAILDLYYGRGTTPYLGFSSKKGTTVDLYNSYEKYKIAEQRKYLINDIAKSIVKTGMTKREAVIAINNYIKNRFVYKITQPNMYIALEQNAGNCTAYTRTFEMIAKDVGIEVENMGDTEHTWNRVKLGGRWYYVDVTWNDSTSSDRYLLSPTLWDNHLVYMKK